MPWDIYQEIRLNDISARQSDEHIAGRNRELDLRDLERLVRKMALVNQALFELLKDRTGITDEELRLKIHEVDVRDGREDHKVSSAPLHCPKCQGKVTAGALKCKSCGATLAPKYPFEE